MVDFLSVLHQSVLVFYLDEFRMDLVVGVASLVKLVPVVVQFSIVGVENDLRIASKLVS